MGHCEPHARVFLESQSRTTVYAHRKRNGPGAIAFRHTEK